MGFGESQVLGEGVNRCETLIVNRGSAAIADASRIHQRGTENVGLFQGGDLAIGLRSYQHRIEAIRRTIGSDVGKVCGVETVFIGNFAINSGCEEVLVDDLLARKGEDSSYGQKTRTR